MSFYSRTYDYDSRIKSNHFVISKVTPSFLRNNGISMNVKDFKAIVRKTKPVYIVLTGGNGHAQHTKVYDINQFKHYQKQEEFNLWVIQQRK